MLLRASSESRSLSWASNLLDESWPSPKRPAGQILGSDAAANIEGLPSNGSRFVRGQQQSHGNDFIGFETPADGSEPGSQFRDRHAEAFGIIIEPPVVHFRMHGSGADGVNGDAVACYLECQRPGQAE